MSNRRDQVNKEIEERDEGKDFRVPEWVSFITLLVGVNKMPKSIPIFIGIPIIVGFAHSWAFARDVALVEVVWVLALTVMALNSMGADGSLRNYMSLVFAENPIGKYLKSKFGEEV